MQLQSFTVGTAATTKSGTNDSESATLVALKILTLPSAAVRVCQTLDAGSGLRVAALLRFSQALGRGQVLEISSPNRVDNGRPEPNRSKVTATSR